MTTSVQTEAIFSALVSARAKIENLFPSAKGYSYTYIPLEDVIDHLKKVLPDFSLGYIQMPSGGDAETVGLTTRIIHASGQWIEEQASFKITDMKGVNVSQQSGAALTYFRRYALCAAFGITGDDEPKDIGSESDDKERYAQAIKNAKKPEELKAAFAAAWAYAVKNPGLQEIFKGIYESRKAEL
jgi:hypothetical protein